MSSLSFPEADRHFARKDGYQKQIVDRALPHCRGFTTAIDIGAHVGLITRQLERHFDIVLSIEPQAENYACLQENVTSADTVNVALSDRKRLLSMHNPAPENSGAWECDWVSSENLVRATTLDSLTDYEPRFYLPDLIKVDIQGHEVPALKGAVQTLKRARPVVIVECWRNGERDNGPRHFMESLNANLVESVGKDLIFAWA